jgi:hypothetical protein
MSYLAEDPTPIERVLGLISLGAATIRSVEELLPELPDSSATSKDPDE